MKNIRISPLNIVAATIIGWAVMGLINQSIAMSTAIWSLGLFIVVIVVDQFFRMMLKRLTRVWWVELVFLLLVILCVWLLRYI